MKEKATLLVIGEQATLQLAKDYFYSLIGTRAFSTPSKLNSGNLTLCYEEYNEQVKHAVQTARLHQNRVLVVLNQSPLMLKHFRDFDAVLVLGSVQEPFEELCKYARYHGAPLDSNVHLFEKHGGAPTAPTAERETWAEWLVSWMW